MLAWMQELPVPIIAFAGISLLWGLWYSYNRPRKFPYPPGPNPLLIVGNWFDLPKDRDYEAYAQWGRDQGSDIVHARSFGHSVVVLNSYKAATELLEKRSSIYSDRPHFVMLHEMLEYFGTGSHPYGNGWRKHRKAYRRHMDPGAITKYCYPQMVATQKLLTGLLDSPQDYINHIRYVTSELMMGITYGMELQGNFEKYVALSMDQTKIFLTAVRPGQFLVDSIPWLKYAPSWVPGTGFKAWAKESKERIKMAKSLPFNDTKKLLASGNARPSFVLDSLHDIGNTDEINEDVRVIKDVAGSTFSAGADTTTATLEWFFLALVLYPGVQKKAQEEIDKVIGQGRLPQFEDRPDLPYVDAFVKELYRYFVVTPVALPHYTTEDDIYEGYYIPAKSTVLGNSWAMMHDPEEYSEPFKFQPERFLLKEGKPPRDPLIGGAFGFGRRICPGRHLADASIFLMVASVLALFNITPRQDEKGDETDVSYALKALPGFFCRPPFFPFEVKPRSGSALSLVQEFISDGPTQSSPSLNPL
ncbi:hypothetical protein M422DRAFT_37307 [Sphaerobolus stellatus SS14]|uniref:Cytochrome P450 n=1 Tax=Sphaerobolus stellatus (strain SS14) TaxID=990650 RepID=A0A0C9UT99_SPHS4|nr:hypothetical protein M422DRAFT_37307 [Sphaerobolus stellatus SS14]